VRAPHAVCYDSLREYNLHLILGQVVAPWSMLYPLEELQLLRCGYIVGMDEDVGVQRPQKDQILRSTGMRMQIDNDSLTREAALGCANLQGFKQNSMRCTHLPEAPPLARPLMLVLLQPFITSNESNQ
jgi:hypothetical protein